MGENLVYWVWLSQCFSYGNGRLGKLLETLDDAKAFFQGGPELWRKSGLFSAQDLRRMEKTSLDRAAVILEECQKQDIRVISWLDEEYPRLLREIYAPPAVLYVKGSLAGLDQALTITAVGTREAIGYTRGVTGNLCYQLAQTGVVIISGCAQGIDEYAHRGTLKAGGRTIAVLGCGVDVNYPAANRELKEKNSAFGRRPGQRAASGNQTGRPVFSDQKPVAGRIGNGCFGNPCAYPERIFDYSGVGIGAGKGNFLPSAI